MKFTFLMTVFVLQSAFNTPTLGDDAEIKAVLTAYENAWNQHDMGQPFAKLFTENASWVNIVGMHWQGKANIVKAHAVFHKIMFHHTALHFYPNPQITLLKPDVAVVVAKCAVEGYTDPSGGKHTAQDDIMTLTLVKENGQWLIAAGENVEIRAEAAANNPIKD